MLCVESSAAADSAQVAATGPIPNAMPSKCAGFEDPAGGPQEGTFASDGHGGRAQARKTSDGGRCVFCSIPAVEHAMNSRIGKGNVIRQLKS